jgi:hypothetical protein
VLRDADDRWPQALLDAEGRLALAYDAADGSAYLLRPDGHVAARFKRITDAALQAALRRAAGQAPGPRDDALPSDAGSARDRTYTALAQGISAAGATRETLFLARLALLLCERLGDEAAAGAAIEAALRDLPEPSLSAAHATY